MDSESNFISGIHNYCDRWCERCEFTARCRVFAMEAEMGVNRDGNIEDALRTVSEIFAQTKQMLVEKAEEMGIDLEVAANDPKITEGIKKARETVKSHPLSALSEKYGMDLVPVMESIDTVVSSNAADDPVVQEMIEIIGGYQLFIAAKTHRALHSLLDFDGEEDADEIHDPQSDANGSAKIALVAVERSILAWTYILTPENAAAVRPFIGMLDQIGRMIEEKLPNARAFVRPGFDEIETIM